MPASVLYMDSLTPEVSGTASQRARVVQGVVLYSTVSEPAGVVQGQFDACRCCAVQGQFDACRLLCCTGTSS